VAKNISMSVVHSAQTITYLGPRLTRSQMDQSVLPLDLRHLEVPTGASKMIYEPITRPT
jgi:hypothetical protein